MCSLSPLSAPLSLPAPLSSPLLSLLLYISCPLLLSVLLYRSPSVDLPLTCKRALCGGLEGAHRCGSACGKPDDREPRASLVSSGLDAAGLGRQLLARNMKQRAWHRLPPRCAHWLEGTGRSWLHVWELSSRDVDARSRARACGGPRAPSRAPVLSVLLQPYTY